MTTNDLLALLRRAEDELSVLASYLDDPKTEWPNFGLKITAKAHRKLRDQIRELLKDATPVEEIPLREENFALRAALMSKRNDEDWRLRYLESEARLSAVAKNQREACEKYLRQRAAEIDEDGGDRELAHALIQAADRVDYTPLVTGEGES